ncbi:MAG: 5-(carboxyamino)imidazole ribonucleotide synthase [Nitrospiraceae bacterium]
MKSSPLVPGAVIGILGGGQLGAMFAAAARRLGYGIAVWDPDPEAPAHRIADRSFAAPFSDDSAQRAFSQVAAVVTYEWENIPVSVCEALERHHPVRPGSRILRILQNRVKQKQFLAAGHLPVPPFVPIRTPDELTNAETLGFPCLCKTATAGYDGKGQWKISTRQDIPSIQERLKTLGSETGWVLERFLDFQCEISVLIVRGQDGDCRAYPPVDNIHEGGILRVTRIPADLEHDCAAQAVVLAKNTVELLEGVGLFCVEMFVMKDRELFINEVAPRPHNSGHYTLDACTVSQFEQQVRAVSGLPLGEVRLLTPAVMVNLIGDESLRLATGESRRELLGVAGASLYLYGKRTVRPGRKMGHVTFVAEKPEVAWDAAMRMREQLGRTKA